jgi:DNA-binding CsgD family transcriptional regulator
MIEQQVGENRPTLGQKVNLRQESELPEPPRALTHRERDILTLAARGLSSQRIGDELGIANCTVKCTMHHACTKLGAQSRLEAVYIALARGYIALDEIISVDELTVILTSLGSQMLREVAKRLKQKQFDELVNLLAPYEPTMLQKAARRLKQSQEQLQLPPISSEKIANLPSVSGLRAQNNAAFLASSRLE